MTVKDFYSNSIVVNALVAFNYMGMVRFGTVESIQASKLYGRSHTFGGEPYLKITIRHMTTNDVSTVTKRMNLVVVKTP